MTCKECEYDRFWPQAEKARAGQNAAEADMQSLFRANTNHFLPPAMAIPGKLLIDIFLVGITNRIKLGACP
jgi:hypothetical protein